MRWPVLLLALLVIAGGCEGAEVEDSYAWTLPEGFPTPRVPEDNPMSEAKVALGRRLFYDARLSINEEMSCGTCHEQSRAFADGRPTPVGATGQAHWRNSMGLTNVAYSARLTWSSPLIARLEDQALLPIFGEEPVEMGMAGHEDLLLSRLRADPDLRARFTEAFPDQPDPISVQSVARAIAAFERTLISGESPYDRAMRGEPEAMSAAAQRGMNLFFSERLECFHCHGGLNFSDTLDHTRMPIAEVGFHNTALYNEDGAGAYPERDRGLIDVTGDPADMGRFRAPTLRNVALTAPYFHDGSAADLNDVIDHYAAGGRADSPLRSPLLKGFVITEAERADLIAFLNALTDAAFITDPRFGDPYTP